MIINIPIQVDEVKMEEVIKRDYEQKVFGVIAEHISTALASNSSYYGTYNREKSGMTNLINARIDKIIDENKAEILEIAGRHLADKLARTKAAKELIENLKADSN